MTMRALPTILGAAILGALAGLVPAHGVKSKPFFNKTKHNAATRGDAGSAATQLYMMQPPRHLTGQHDFVGYDVTLQDENPLTVESLDLSIVRFASGGSGMPDETTGGEVVAVRSFFVFGFPPPGGGKAFEFRLTIGNPITLPDHFGIGIGLAASPNWPASDGLSVQAQLNLANDPLRPRVPAPYQGRAWAFERFGGAASATPLGGRSLDTLAVSPVLAGTVLHPYVASDAYGSGVETLYGPESMFPSAARGDGFGVFVDTASPNFPLLVLYLSPKLLTPSWCCMGIPNDRWYIGLDPPFPVLLSTTVLDANGQATLGPWPVSALPPGLRDFWLQGAVISPALQMQLTDAIGFEGQ